MTETSVKRVGRVFVVLILAVEIKLECQMVAWTAAQMTWKRQEKKENTAGSLYCWFSDKIQRHHLKYLGFILIFVMLKSLQTIILFFCFHFTYFTNMNI